MNRGRGKKDTKVAKIGERSRGVYSCGRKVYLLGSPAREYPLIKYIESPQFDTKMPPFLVRKNVPFLTFSQLLFKYSYKQRYIRV